jgi:hypothetical protein
VLHFGKKGVALHFRCDNIRHIRSSKFMQRFNRTSPLAGPTNEIKSPELVVLSEAASAVPSSFADWLSQPTCDIAADLEPVQGTFAGLMNQCTAQNLSRQSDPPDVELRRPAQFVFRR